MYRRIRYSTMQLDLGQFLEESCLLIIVLYSRVHYNINNIMHFFKLLNACVFLGIYIHLVVCYTHHAHRPDNKKNNNNCMVILNIKIKVVQCGIFLFQVYWLVLIDLCDVIRLTMSLTFLPLKQTEIPCIVSHAVLFKYRKHMFSINKYTLSTVL